MSQTATDAAIAAINNSVSVIQALVGKTTNIIYDSTNNRTKIYGHTNFEELNVLGSPVALQSQLTTKADVEHTHDLDDVVMTYKEEEETVNEEEETVMTTITKTKTLSEILDDK